MKGTYLDICQGNPLSKQNNTGPQFHQTVKTTKEEQT